MGEERIQEISQQQDELRKQRDEYCSKMQECQNKIDDLEKEKYDANAYLGKIIFLNWNSIKNSTHCYLQVKNIERLMKGPRFSGPCIEIYREGNKTCYIETAAYREITQYTWADVQAGKVQVVSNMQEIKDELIVSQNCLDMGDLPIGKLDGEVVNTKKYRWYVEGKND